MSKLNNLLLAPPYPVESSLKRLGANLRTARLRRNLTLAEMAEKIGTGIRAVREAEKGNPATGIAVYMALLWVFDLLNNMDFIADPTRDEEGLLLALRRDRIRARHVRKVGNDF